jgi:hypothetical protein
MKKFTSLVLLAIALTLPVDGQKKMKPWTEWSEKEVLKILNDSAWGQTQNETNTSEMFYRPTQGSGSSNRPLDTPSDGGNNRGAQGALNQATNVSYHIRLLTAKPIRQAIARRAQIQNPQLAEQLKSFAEQQSDQYIVVVVDHESPDKRFSGQALQLFNSANTGILRNATYLENNDGKRLFLQQYLPPAPDGMGAKFVFPRTVDNEPFVDEKSNYLRFYSEFPKTIKLNMRFKISQMIYDGKLEY